MSRAFALSQDNIKYLRVESKDQSPVPVVQSTAERTGPNGIRRENVAPLRADMKAALQAFSQAGGTAGRPQQESVMRSGKIDPDDTNND